MTRLQSASRGDLGTLSEDNSPRISSWAQTKKGPSGPRHAKCPLLVSDVLLSHGLLRSTIGARGLNFRVRNGTGCASPAMVADQQGAFCFQGRPEPCPGGRTA